MALLSFSRGAFQKVLERGMKSDRLREELDALGDVVLRTKRDASAVVEALRRIARVERRPADRYRTSTLHSLAALFLDADGGQAWEVLSRDGIAELQRIFDASLPAAEDDDDDHLFVLKVLAMYRAPALVETLTRAIRDPLLSERFLWSVILSSLSDDVPLRGDIVEALREPLPQGHAGDAFLDFCNQVVAADGLPHPFDNEKGQARLIEMLESGDADRAVVAAAAIPFLPNSDVAPLLERASAHGDRFVRLECEWAYARLGDEHGVVELARAAQDPRTATRARAYLTELGRPEAIPRAANEPAFLALAELSDWLSYPTEYGRPPEELRLVDTRELFWPPTNDTRRLYLIEYRYPDESGLGLVGSITFSLFDDVPADMSPEDAYALHCCWELQVKHDPRAPEEISVEEGRRLLGWDRSG